MPRACDIPDVLVVGAGPAGMFAAASARRSGADVVMLERNSRPGRKMAITGGGRCNLTNSASHDEIIKNIPGNGKFITGALYRFSNVECLNFFANLGIFTKQEEGGRVFPVGKRAGQVVSALESHLLSCGVNIYYRARAAELILSGCGCKGIMADDGRTFYGRTVIIATGGLSYPQTGSTGDGYRLAGQAGHGITPTCPALVPLCCEEKEIIKQLQGLTLKEITLGLVDGAGRTIALAKGDVVFTHFGISGPAALSLSREVSACNAAGASKLKLVMDTLPGLGEDALAGKLLSLSLEQPQKSAGNILKLVVADRLAEVILQLLAVDGSKRSGETGKGLWRQLARAIKNFSLTAAGTRPHDEAMITSGGVSTREINPRTMESLLVDCLYFAGEVMDVDAYTGGFNMQIAFSTGWVAGMSAAGKARLLAEK